MVPHPGSMLSNYAVTLTRLADWAMHRARQRVSPSNRAFAEMSGIAAIEL